MTLHARIQKYFPGGGVRIDSSGATLFIRNLDKQKIKNKNKKRLNSQNHKIPTPWGRGGNVVYL